MVTAETSILDLLVARGRMDIIAVPTEMDVLKIIHKHPKRMEKVTPRRMLMDFCGGPAGDGKPLRKALKAAGTEPVTKQGNLGKRLRKALIEFQPALDDPMFHTAIGEATAGFSIKFEKGPFDWQHGAFGDKDSCVMNPDGCHSEMKAWLHKIDACVLKVYKGGKGIGRCWAFGKGDLVFLSNAYGKPMSVLAPMVAKHLGLSYKEAMGLPEEERRWSIFLNGDGHLLYPKGMSTPERFHLLRHFNLPVLCDGFGHMHNLFHYDPLKDQFYVREYPHQTLSLRPYNKQA